MIRVLLFGALGRMGTEIRAAISQTEDLKVVGLAESPGHPAVGQVIDGHPIKDHPDWTAGDAEVVVDFTTAQATATMARYAATCGMGFVSGTTGLSEADLAVLEEASRSVPLLHASNMSQGVTALRALVQRTAAMLGGYDVEIVEMHHRRKTDAPSGTALSLAAAVQSVRRDLKTVHGRVGSLGARGDAELGVHALRGGDVVGEHQVIFAGTGERLKLTHIADHRGAFAAGVLAACRFVADRAPGLYTMEDVLGL